jgi:hypothetical protein
VAVEIVPYESHHTRGVQVLNERVRSGGITSLYPASPHGLAILEPGSNPYHEMFVAVEGNDVRGGYMLKHQAFYLHGGETSIGCFQLPVSLGTVDHRYAAIGLLVLRHALKRQPLLFSLGLGGHEEAVTRMLAASRWTIQTVPFFFRVVNVRRFLRGMRYLRRSPGRRLLLDTLAATGLGSLAVRWAQGTRRGTAAPCQSVDTFGAWADPIWHERKGDFALGALRDGATLSKLYDRPGQKTLRLVLGRGAERTGWAACLATQFENHKYFGDLKVGTIVDGLCLRGQERSLFGAAIDLLESHQVDLIVTNQSFLPYRQAIVSCGFRSGPSNFLFASSPALTERLTPAAETLARTLLNRGDGDGPVNL